MLANTKTNPGGDLIIFAFNHNNSNTSSAGMGEVNRLISTCATSRDSLEQLYIMFKSAVFAVAYGITSDYHLSEDCVAETFVRLTQVRNFNPHKGDGKGFILTTARNVASELRRRYKKEINSYIIQSYGDAEKTVEDSIYINQLLKHLNDKQRQIVIMKCCAEMTFKDIAMILKCPETTVKSRYKRAMDILQEKAGADK